MTSANTIAGVLPDKCLIGMLHVRALPGTPLFTGDSIESLAAKVVDEAGVLADAGFDALIVENMHDAPYVHGSRLGPEITAAMTRVAAEIKRATSLPLGIQILSGGNHHALAAALATGASFIRCENFVFSHVADEGLFTEAEAGPLLRYRKSIGAGDVRVFADIKKKHASHAITADISLAEAAQAAKFFQADGLIVTGSATGCPTSAADVQSVTDACDLPVLVGSGVTTEDAAGLLRVASGLIVGSSIKRDGRWDQPVDLARARAIVDAARN